MRVVRAPLRVDLSGGWTDLSPFTSDFGGEVVNFAINKYVKAKLEDSGEVTYEFDVQTGSGLGTSGALNVARIAVLQENDTFSRDEIAEAAFQAEISSGNRCGRQDQWAASHGGFNRFMFLGNNVEKMPFEPAPSAVKWLRKHLLIAHTGISHKSGNLQNEIWSRYDNGEKNVIEGLHKIRLATRKIAGALQRDQRQLVVESINEVSDGVDMIDPSINAPFIPIIEPMMQNRSVMAWKALGAGAGGCAAILCNPMNINKVREKISEVNWELIDWDYDNIGIKSI